LPPAICVSITNIINREAAKKLLCRNSKLISRVKNLMIDSGYRIDKFLFNIHNVDKMLQHLMKNSIKVKASDCLGKVIISAVN